MDFLEQPEIALGVKGGVDAHALAPRLGGLAALMQALDDDGPLRLVGGPVVAATAQRQEGHRHTAHLVHRVETVFGKREISVFLGEVLGVESAHGHCSHLNAQTVGGLLEKGGFLGYAQFVLKGVALTE